MTMPYYNVPLVVLEDADALSEWAARAVAVAKAGKAGKRARTPKNKKKKNRR